MSEQTIADVLERAADRLSKPRAWTQKANARRADNLPTTSIDEEAVCWCMAGAVFAEDVGDDLGAFAALKKVFPHRDDHLDPVVAFNDAPGRTQSEVVAKLREAATAARAQGEA